MRNSNLIPEKQISRGGNTTITTTHGKQFKSYLRMRYFLTKHLIQHIFVAGSKCCCDWSVMVISC
ncbi:hypothetical protein LDENG_00204170 [Lucifuga dentata]|nr:hypothetical protein LDENG_00204170 [Lucifuga dentata]